MTILRPSRGPPQRRTVVTRGWEIKGRTCMPGGGCWGGCWGCCAPAGGGPLCCGRGPRAGAAGVITTVGAGAGPGRAVPEHEQERAN